MATMDTPWAGLVPVTVEVRKPTAGAAWHPVNCQVSRLHAAGGRAEWSGQVDPSVLSAVLNNVKGTVDIPAGSHCRVTLKHHQIFQGRVLTAVRSARPGGYSTITIHAVDDLGSLATAYLDDPRDLVEPWDAADAHVKGDRTAHDSRYWKALKASTGVEPGTDATAWARMSDIEFVTGTGDTFKERCGRILDRAGWAKADRDLDDTLNWRLEGTWYGRTALEELKLIAQSVGAWVYLSREGKISTGFPDDVGAPTWTIYAEAQPPGHDPICASSFQQADSMEHVVNDVYLSHHGGGMSYVKARDTASQTAYGVRSYMQADLQNLYHLTDLATDILAHGKRPHDRLKSVTIPIDTQQAASMLDQFAIGDRLHLAYDNGLGDTLDELEGFIVGWLLDLDTSRATLRLTTGHPLDVKVQTVPPAMATGGGAGGTGGTPGAPGPTGPQGPRGTMWVEGPTPPTATNPPGPAGGFMVGDAYLDTANGELYLYQSTGWSDSGVSLRGPEGPMGPHGTAVTVLGTVPTVADLPKTGNTDADVHFVTGTGDLYIWEHLPGDPAGGAWHDMGHVQGPQGVRGPQGPRGQISDAHGDARYVKKSGDTMTGRLILQNAFWLQTTTTTPGFLMKPGHIIMVDSHGHALGDAISIDAHKTARFGATGALEVSAQGNTTVKGRLYFPGSATNKHNKAEGHYTSGNGQDAPWIVISTKAPGPHEPNAAAGCLWIQV